MLGTFALWIDSIPSLVHIIADGLAALVFLVGAMIWEVRVAPLTSSCGPGSSTDTEDMQVVCYKSADDMVTEFTSSGVALVLVGLGFLMMKRKGTAPKGGV